MQPVSMSVVCHRRSSNMTFSSAIADHTIAKKQYWKRGGFQDMVMEKGKMANLWLDKMMKNEIQECVLL